MNPDPSSDDLEDVRTNKRPDPSREDLDYERTLKGLRPGLKLFGRRYLLRRQLGKGGMGVVWLAEDIRMEAEVALKFLPDMVVHDAAALDDLRQETLRCKTLSHDHVVRVYGLLFEDSMAAIEMEYVDGKNLSELRLEREHRVFEVEEIAVWVEQLCVALTYAHEQAKIVHRDLKPANVMVNGKGMVKVMDFGIAANLGDTLTRLTRVSGGGTKMGGTPPYMSPQQLMGGAPCVSDDVYGLGATIYELLTGKPPFFRGDLVRQIEQVIPPSLAERRRELGVAASGQIPQSWEETVARCLAKEVEARPASASEVSWRLGGAAGAADSPRRVVVPVKERAGQGKPFADSTKGARGWMRKVAVPVGAALAIAMGGGWWFGYEAPRRESAELDAMAREAEVAQAGEQLLVAKLLWERILERRPSDERALAGLERLAAVTVSVMVTTEPKGAEIRLGDREPVKTPAEWVNVGLGEHPVVIDLPGYRRVETILRVGNGESVTLAKTLERERGSLTVDILPGDIEATVRCLTSAIDSAEERRFQKRGLTPLELGDLPSGKYEVTAARKGWPAFKQEIELGDGAKAAVAHDFAEGSLRIESHPVGQPAELTAPDGKVIASGPTPLVAEGLPAGPGYRVVMRRQGWPDFRQENLAIVKGENPPVSWKFAEGSITLASQPVGAKVILYAPASGKGSNRAKVAEGETPLVVEKLPAGAGYRVELDWEGRDKHVADDLTIVDGVNPPFTHLFATNDLELASEPPGQRVTVIRNATGKPHFSVDGETPFTAKDLPLGEGYTVIFARDGWPNYQVDATIEAGEGAAIRFRFPESRLTVAMKGLPDAGRGLPLYVNFDRKWQGEAITVTALEGDKDWLAGSGRDLRTWEMDSIWNLIRLPIENALFAPGELRMRVHSPGWLTREETINLTEGNVLHEINWEMANVQINSDPPGAEVWEGGRKIGATPMQVVLPKGQWMAYRLALEGYRNAFVEGIAGQDGELSVPLQPRSEFRGPHPEFDYFSHFGEGFTYCPPGLMWLGADKRAEEDLKNKGMQTVHTEVHGFWLADKPIRVELDEERDGIFQSSGTDTDPLLPTWEQARRYCQILTRQAHHARKIPTDWAYRMPTEEEWEYGMRRRLVRPGGREWTLSAYRGLNDDEVAASGDLPTGTTPLKTWRGFGRKWATADEEKWRLEYPLYLNPLLWWYGKAGDSQSQMVDLEVRVSRGLSMPHRNQAGLRPVLAPMVFAEETTTPPEAPAVALTPEEASVCLNEAWVLVGGPKFSDWPLVAPEDRDTAAARRLFEAVRDSSFTSPTQVREAQAGLEALENLNRLDGGALFQVGSTDLDFAVVREDGTVFLPDAGEATRLVGPLGIAYRKGDKWGILNFAGEVRTAPVWDEILYGESGCFIVRDGPALRCVHADADSPFADRSIPFSDTIFINPVRGGLNYYNESESLIYRWIPGEDPIRIEVNGGQNSPGDYSFSKRKLMPSSPTSFWPEKYKRVNRNIRMELISRIESGGKPVDEIESQKKIDVLDFYQGYSPTTVISTNSGMGLMSATGRQLVAPEWTELLRISQDYLAGKKDGKMGLLSLSGEMLWPPQFDSVEGVDHHVFRVGIDGKFGLVDAKGGWRLKPEWQSIGTLTQLSLKLPGDQNAQATHRALESRWLGPIVAEAVSAANGKKGLVSDEGDVLIRPDWDDLAAPDVLGNGNEVRWVIRVKQGEKWGLLGSKGELLIKPEWDEVSQPAVPSGASGLQWVAQVKRDGKWGIVDSKGGLVIQPEWDEVSPTVAQAGPLGLQWVALVRRGGKWGLMDSMGRSLLEANCDQIEALAARRFRFQRGGLWGLLTINGFYQNGVRLFEPKWSELRMASEDLMAGNEGGRWGLIDLQGQGVGGTQWEEIRDFRGGLAAAKRNGKWGFVDREGDWVVEPEWDSVGDFFEGRAAVVRGKGVGMIDPRGTVLRVRGASPAEDAGLYWETVWPLNYGLAKVKQNGKVGLIRSLDKGNGNQTGEESLELLVDCQFDEIEPLDTTGFAVVTADGNKGLLYRNQVLIDPVGQPGWGKIEKARQDVWELRRDESSIYPQAILTYAIDPNTDKISRYDVVPVEGWGVVAVSDGQLVVKFEQGGKWGLMVSGRQVVPAMWSEIFSPVVADRFRAQVRDESGKVTLECLYDLKGNVLWSSDESTLPLSKSRDEE